MRVLPAERCNSLALLLGRVDRNTGELTNPLVSRLLVVCRDALGQFSPLWLAAQQLLESVIPLLTVSASPERFAHLLVTSPEARGQGAGVCHE